VQLHIGESRGNGDKIPGSCCAGPRSDGNNCQSQDTGKGGGFRLDREGLTDAT